MQPFRFSKLWIALGLTLCSAPGWAVTPLIYYTRAVIADRTDARKFSAAMKFVAEADRDWPLTRVVPTDLSCDRSDSDYPRHLSADEARRFVDDRSIVGTLEFQTKVVAGREIAVSAFVRTSYDTWKTIDEGGTLIGSSARGAPITIRLKEGDVYVGRYKAVLGSQFAASDGNIVVVDGCGRLD